MEDNNQPEGKPEQAVPTEQSPTSSMARPPGEDADMAAALKSLSAFHSAMGRGKPAAEEPAEEKVVEAQPEVKPEPKTEAVPSVDVSRFEQELATLKAELAKRDDLARKAKLNPIEFLKENGVTLDQVTDWLQHGDESKAAAELKRQAVEKELEEYRARDQQSKQEQSKKAEEAARRQAGVQYRDAVIKPAISESKYPVSYAVHGDELPEVLLALAIDSFRRTGNEPSIDDLAKTVETRLAAVKTKLVGDQQPRKDPPPPSLKSLQSSTQVPTGTKHEESDDDEAMAAAVSKLKKLRQGI
jgi:DNA-binding transcriptional MerR regulator